MADVRVAFHSKGKNLDGKIYTPELVQLLLAKLKTYKHVFTTPVAEPKSMTKDIVGDVLSIREEADGYVADFSFYPAFKHVEGMAGKFGIFFSAMTTEQAKVQDVIDADDVFDPIVFSMMEIR